MIVLELEVIKEIPQKRITKCCRKAPSFSCGDIRQLFLRFY